MTPRRCACPRCRRAAEALTSLRALLDGPAPAGRAPRARLEVV